MENVTLDNWKQAIKGNLRILQPEITGSNITIDFAHSDFCDVERIFYTLGVWLVSRETLPDRKRCRIVEMELMSDFIKGADDALNGIDRKISDNLH